MKEQLAIDCQACHAPKFMFATKVPRFHGVVRIIGVVLVIPSILGLCFSAFMFIVFLVSTANTPTPKSDAEMTGQAVGFAAVGGVILVIGIISLVSGLVGWLLLLSRKVFKCRRCGFILERA